MNAYLSKSERAVYEQRRRKAVIQESKDYRLLSKWLLKVHPDTVAEFHAYRSKLQRLNPIRKDLTTSPQFARFMRGEDGTGICFAVFSLVVCDCEVFMLCFLDTEVSLGFSLEIPLIGASESPAPAATTVTLSESPKSPAPAATTVTLSENPKPPAPAAAVIAPSENPIPPATVTTTVIHNENPFNLTDTEIDEMLRILEGGGVLPNRAPVDVVYDQDLQEVLNMDVEHFVV